PGRVTDLTRDIRLVVREVPFAVRDFGHVTPAYAIATESFGVSRLRIVVVRARIDRVDRLGNLPNEIGGHSRALKEFASLPVETGAVRRIAFAQIDSAAVSSGLQRGTMVYCPMAIDALDGGRGAWFTVKQPVPVNVGFEMAIGALHPVREMRVFQM